MFRPCVIHPRAACSSLSYDQNLLSSLENKSKFVLSLKNKSQITYIIRKQSSEVMILQNNNLRLLSKKWCCLLFKENVGSCGEREERAAGAGAWCNTTAFLSVSDFSAQITISQKQKRAIPDSFLKTIFFSSYQRINATIAAITPIANINGIRQQPHPPLPGGGGGGPKGPLGPPNPGPGPPGPGPNIFLISFSFLLLFQSTHPIQGVTYSYFFLILSSFISIHAPYTGCDTLSHLRALY